MNSEPAAIPGIFQRHLLAFIIAVSCFLQIQAATAAAGEAIDHVVIIWLKEPGNTRAQDTIIKASRSLKTIPGVISIRSGRMVPSQRPIVDSSFDVAMIITFIDQAALVAYLVHPTHKALLDEIMLPLVERIRVYDLK